MAESRKLDVAGCGSMVVDYFYRTPRVIGAGEKILLAPHLKSARVERSAVGGVMLNQLGWASVLGARAGIFGKLGDDPRGASLRAGMDRLKIEQNVTLDGSASAFAAIFVDPSGERAIYMARGATAELKADEIARRHGEFIRRAALVSTEVSQLPLKTVIAILRLARAHSIQTILDVDVPPSDACASLGTRRELEQALRLATIIKPAKIAARELARGNDPLRLAESIRARYKSRAVVITDGGNGCAISAHETARRIPAFRIRPIDTTGAGDAFLGAMVAGIAQGLPWDGIGRLANAAGAVCATRLGAFPAGFELRDEVLRLYGADLPSNSHPLAAADDLDAAPAAKSFDAEVESFFEASLDELAGLRQRLDLKSISRAVEMIRAGEARGGRLHLTGVGKPEHVARYGASLLSSVGTPATFLHATEALHGSLGQVHKHDLVIAISNSGNTPELCATASAIKEHGAQLIAITGDARSVLAGMADLTLNASVRREGGGLELAPRASVLAEVLVVAGLSVALEAARGLTAEEYGKLHRAGALGDSARRLISERKRAS